MSYGCRVTASANGRPGGFAASGLPANGFGPIVSTCERERPHGKGLHSLSLSLMRNRIAQSGRQTTDGTSP